MPAAVTERRRPAVPVYPLAAVPAATVARVLPAVHLGRTPSGDVAHQDLGDRLRCSTRVTALVDVDQPIRMCTLCSAALGFPSKVPAWQPTREELAEVHMAAARRVIDTAAEQLLRIRSAAIHDGSALIRVDQVSAWRAEHGIPDDEPLPPLRATFLVGEALTPVQVVAQRRATSQHMTDVLAASNARHREDRIDARRASKAIRSARPECPYCHARVLVAADSLTEETVLVDPRPVPGGHVELRKAPGLDQLIAIDHVTTAAAQQPAHELHARTCLLWPSDDSAPDLDDDIAEKSGGWRR